MPCHFAFSCYAADYYALFIVYYVYFAITAFADATPYYYYMLPMPHTPRCHTPRRQRYAASLPCRCCRHFRALPPLRHIFRCLRHATRQLRHITRPCWRLHATTLLIPLLRWCRRWERHYAIRLIAAMLLSAPRHGAAITDTSIQHTTLNNIMLRCWYAMLRDSRRHC